MNNGIKLILTDSKGNEHKITGFSNISQDAEKETSIESSDNKAIKINPLDFLEKMNCYETLNKIRFDKNLEPDVVITGKVSGDGTLAIIDCGILEIISKAIQESMKNCIINNTDIIKDLDASKFRWIIGEIEMQRDFGIVDLPAGFYPGEIDTITVPIKCGYLRLAKGAYNE